MYCKNCGKEIADNSNFCSVCGHPQKDGLNQPPIKEVRWEYCDLYIETTEIKKVGGFLSNQYIHTERLATKMTTPAGISYGPHSDSWEAEGDSSIVHPIILYGDSYKKSYRANLDKILTRLLKEGWEIVNTEDIWRKKLRRIWKDSK